MYCPRCGTENPDSAAFCGSCGAPLGDRRASQMPPRQPGQNPPDPSLNYIMPEPQVPYGSGSAPVDPNAFVNGTRRPIQTDRNLLLYIVLSIVTCDIYAFYFIYKLAQDINIMCVDDGERTGGLAAYILLSIVTCGIYSYYWMYKIGNRHYNNAPNYGLHFDENGTTILLWCIIGFLLCGIGPFIAMYFIIRNTNAMAAAYNARFVYGR